MRFSLGLLLAAAVWGQPQATVRAFTHNSQVMGENRSYNAVLPPSYAAGQKRYPVVYWLHGFETSTEQQQISRDEAAYVTAHEVIVVNAGPAETVGAFPLYFPELVEQADQNLRTFADRDHRAVTGYSAGGFMALWIAGKYPDLLSSASSLMGPTEYSVGPKGFDVECNFDDFYGNYDGVRTRLVSGTRDFLQFYHRRLNAIWTYAAAAHETEALDSDHAPTGISKTLDFHMAAFAKPLPKPAMFNHADVYPNFGVWGWEVASDRRQPAVTVLENVSRSGFRSAVREWMPGGATLPEVKLSITSPARLYAPRSTHPVTFIHLTDGKVRRSNLRADAQGRLTFDLDGDAWEIGVGVEPVVAITGYEPVNASWATAGKPVTLRLRFCNKGAGRMPTLPVQWASPNPGVKFDAAPSKLFGLASGESAAVPVTFTVADPARAIVKIIAVAGGTHLSVDVPLYPAAQPTKDFQIADSRSLTVFQRATQKEPLALGDGNGDGFAAPGETIAVLLPDGDAYRAAEIFTSDACVDNSVRVSDTWVDYDHSGASAKYSLPRIQPTCQPGTIVHMLARVVVPNAPNHEVRYYALEFPVWYRNGK